MKRFGGLLAIIAFLNTFALLVLQAWWMAGVFLGLGMTLVNVSRTKPLRFLGSSAIAGFLILMVATAPVTLSQLTTGMRSLGDQAIEHGPSSLSFPTRFGLWWSAIWLSIGGVAYMTPYTVAEQILMFWPGATCLTSAPMGRLEVIV